VCGVYSKQQIKNSESTMNNQLPFVANLAENRPFPPLNPGTSPIEPKSHVEKGTGLVVFLAYLVAIFGVLLGGVFSYGVLWVVLLIAPIADYFNRKKAMALLRGSAIEVGPTQFAEIHQCAQTFARRLGMQTLPAIYIVEGNAINAAAMKFAGRQVVILQDDLVDACLHSGDGQTLAFILGHEITHHALGHTGLIRSGLSRVLNNLSRLDEFTCDAVANALVGDMNVSTRAIALLATGPQLIPYLNFHALMQQAQQVEADKNAKKAERKLTHPLLLRRLSRFIS
jgi:Zn-dependent protease with chaperone function